VYIDDASVIGLRHGAEHEPKALLLAVALGETFLIVVHGH
jgi:hypothetical protein